MGNKKRNITAIKRKSLRMALTKVLAPTYFKHGVPLQEIQDCLRNEGVIMLMEDDTEWNGILLGKEGRCFIRLAPVETKWTPDKQDGEGEYSIDYYEKYENTGLVLTWYKMETRFDLCVEVTGYIS